MSTCPRPQQLIFLLDEELSDDVTSDRQPATTDATGLHQPILSKPPLRG